MTCSCTPTLRFCRVPAGLLTLWPAPSLCTLHASRLGSSIALRQQRVSHACFCEGARGRPAPSLCQCAGSQYWSSSSFACHAEWQLLLGHMMLAPLLSQLHCAWSSSAQF
jgi:hypothetical protein